MKRQETIKGVFCVIGGFLLHFSFGTIYTFGNMSPYITSYLRNRTNSSDWVNNGHLVWVFSSSLFFQGAFMSLGGILERKLGARLTCLIGGWTMSLGTVLTYFSVKTNLWSVLITYGVLFGTGTGLSYSVALARTIKWFELKKGLVVGIVVGGFGLGSLVFNLIQTRFINPYNIPPMNINGSVEKYFVDSNVLDRVPWCFIVIGVSYATIQLLGVILLTEPVSRKSAYSREKDSKETTNGKENVCVESKDENMSEVLLHGILPISGEHSNETNTTSIPSAPSSKGDQTAFEAIKTKRFWILWFTFFSNGMSVVVSSSLYKAFGQTFISNDSFFAAVGAVAAIFNSGGRVVWGRLLDAYPYRIIMSCQNAMTILVMGTFYLCCYVNSGSGAMAMYSIWVFLMFFALSGNFAMFPTTTSKTFGQTNMAIIYGLVFFGFSLCSMIGALVCSMLLTVITYFGLFIIASISGVISLILTQFF